MVRVCVLFISYFNAYNILNFKKQAFVMNQVKVNAQTLADALLKLMELQNVSVTEGWSWMLMVSLAMVLLKSHFFKRTEMCFLE
jgi:hypothetical protein